MIGRNIRAIRSIRMFRRVRMFRSIRMIKMVRKFRNGVVRNITIGKNLKTIGRNKMRIRMIKRIRTIRRNRRGMVGSKAEGYAFICMLIIQNIGIRLTLSLHICRALCHSHYKCACSKYC